MLQVALGLGLGLVLGYSLGRMQGKRDLPASDRDNIRKRPLSRPASSSDVAAEGSMPNAKEIAAAKAARARLGYQGGAVPVRCLIATADRNSSMRSSDRDPEGIVVFRPPALITASCQTGLNRRPRILSIWMLASCNPCPPPPRLPRCARVSASLRWDLLQTGPHTLPLLRRLPSVSWARANGW